MSLFKRRKVASDHGTISPCRLKLTTKRKLPWETAVLHPNSSSALIVNARTFVLRSRSAWTCFGSPSAAIAAAILKTLMLYGIFNFSSGLIVSARPIA